MTGNTPAHELYEDFGVAEDQSTIAHGVWFSARRQAENQLETEAS